MPIAEVLLVDDSDDELMSFGERFQQLVQQRRSHSVASRVGVSAGQYRKMKRWSLPDAFIQLICFVQFSHGWPKECYSAIGWTCGTGMVVRAFRERAYAAAGYDCVHGPDEDSRVL